MYDIMMDSFDHLPIACLLNNRFIALHGGLTPELIGIKDIDVVDRICEPV